MQTAQCPLAEQPRPQVHGHRSLLMLGANGGLMIIQRSSRSTGKHAFNEDSDLGGRKDCAWPECGAQPISPATTCCLCGGLKQGLHQALVALSTN